jgi:hypothetical protein
MKFNSRDAKPEVSTPLCIRDRSLFMPRGGTEEKMGG